MLRMLAAGLAVLGAAGAAIGQGELVIERDFATGESASGMVCTDPGAWRLDRGSLWQHSAGGYEPTHRSPYNMALFEAEVFGSFVLEADVMQTGREYAHRDVCLVFAFQDPDNFCYAHLSSEADENAHNVFVVDDSPRTPITTRRSGGVDWGWNKWRRVRVEFDGGAGTVRVLVDGEEVLFSDAVPFEGGRVGFGTFDDEARFDNVRVWSDSVSAADGRVFEPVGSVVHEREITSEALDDRLRVMIGGELFAEYVWKGVPRPYLAPVMGPGGVRMTRAYPMEEIEGEAHDHPHHTGLWWAHGDINGLDLWHKGARLVPQGPVFASGRTVLGVYGLESDDGPTGVTVMQTISFEELANGDRAITYGVAVSAAPDEPLVFGDTKEGTMAVRTHPSLRLTPDGDRVPEVTGRARNSEGVTGKEVWGKRAAWVDYSGEIEGSPVGVAVFDYGENPQFPTWWHARDYGLVAANPFGVSAFEPGQGTGRYEVPAGGAVVFEYRFYFHRFGTDAARVGDAYEAWSARDVRR